MAEAVERKSLLSQYEVGKKLGVGSTGTVYRAENKTTGEKVRKYNTMK